MPVAFLALYQRIILNNPWRAIVAIGLITLFMAIGLPNFKLDASADSLTLEYDDDLNFFREVSKRYDSDNFLIITFSPKSGDIFDNKNLKVLDDISSQLKKINGIEEAKQIKGVEALRLNFKANDKIEAPKSGGERHGFSIIKSESKEDGNLIYENLINTILIEYE